MDLQILKTKKNEQDIFIGVSAKLKKENKLSLEKTKTYHLTEVL